MKISRFLSVASAAFFIASSALAQTGTVTNHAFAVGKGPGTQGFTSVLCSLAQIAIGQTSADPICRTVSGDITIDGTGLTAIGANKVINAQFRQSGALSLVGRSANSTGNVADISATAASSCVFMESASTLTCAAIQAANIASNVITNAKLAQAGANTVKGNPTGSTANEQDVAPATARSSSLLNIDQATATSDANYTILATDRSVYHNALTAARTDTLPAANSVNPGQSLIVFDPQGLASGVKTITLQRASADLVNGGTTFVAITSANGMAACVSDGSGRWGCASWGGGAGGGVTSVTPGNGLVSSTTAACSQTAITTSGTLSAAECFDPRTTTTETINDSDRGKVLTFNNASAVGASIAVAGGSSNFQAGWYVDIRNIGAGAVTITPTTSTINGQSSYAIPTGGWGRLYSDGTNYQFGTAMSTAALDGNPSNPVAVTSTTGAMQGIGSTCTITPKLTGRIKVDFATSITSSAAQSISYQFKFGTGSAPANGAAATGTNIGGLLSQDIRVGTASYFAGQSGILTGQAIGTALWFDLDTLSSSGSVSLTAPHCVIQEF